MKVNLASKMAAKLSFQSNLEFTALNPLSYHSEMNINERYLRREMWSFSFPVFPRKAQHGQNKTFLMLF